MPRPIRSLSSPLSATEVANAWRAYLWQTYLKSDKAGV